MRPQVDFGTPDSILRVLEAQELGNDDLSLKYCLYIEKSRTNETSYFDPGVSGASLNGFRVQKSII